MRILIVSSSFLLFGTISFVSAQGPSFLEAYISAFRQVISVPAEPIVVPTVVEVVLPIQGERESFMVIEDETSALVPSYFKEVYRRHPVPLVIEATINGERTDAWELIDDARETSLSFPLPETRRGKADIILSSDASVTASSLHFDFAQNTLLATSIEIRAYVDGRERIVLSEIPFVSENVSFIPTTATMWRITLQYAQPLEIHELTLAQDEAEQTVTRGLRFLAQPGRSYTIYHDADRNVTLPYREAGNLVDDRGVRTIEALSSRSNPFFVPADSDADGVGDVLDNCVMIANPTQDDVDKNGMGDICEDFDRDYRSNAIDNCPTVPNAYQEDADGDGIGDACDAEESRITERLPWVPWVGIGMAGLVLLILFVFVLKDAHVKQGQ